MHGWLHQEGYANPRDLPLCQMDLQNLCNKVLQTLHDFLSIKAE